MQHSVIEPFDGQSLGCTGVGETVGVMVAAGETVGETAAEAIGVGVAVCIGVGVVVASGVAVGETGGIVGVVVVSGVGVVSGGEMHPRSMAARSKDTSARIIFRMFLHYKG